MLALLRQNKCFRRLIAAHAQSQLGSGAAYVALLLLAYQRLHSGWAIALVLLGDFLPGVLLGIPFGGLADRHDRRVLAVIGDMARAAAFAAIALIPSFTATLLFALAAGAGTALWRPAVHASLPGLVQREERNAANAAYGACINLGMTVGPGLSALLLLFVSPALVLIVNAATFALSALLLHGVPMGHAQSGREHTHIEEARGVEGFAGLLAVARLPGLLALITVSAATCLTGALINVAEPLLAVGPLDAGNTGYAVLVAGCGVGMLAASIANARGSAVLWRLRERWLFGIALAGIALIGSGRAPALWIALLTFALTGIANQLIAGPQMRLTQELAPEQLLGRAFGLSDTLQSLAFVLAFLCAGALLGAVGVRALFYVAGGTTLLLALVGALTFRLSPRLVPSAA